ncbi:hypothetical protein [Xanthomonas phage Xp15]|uniref:Uncharacterized protein n=1 Tax=Xanthomonas phage Xp15 TaxID=322855 RepID=Q52PQ6_9CAUD|nr:hypothetical protein XPXV15_gp66 [Xanthomonas phage Xp15]AAX84902.1 hypothetical protein [Xanthomonas phage Xp15]
MVSHGSSRCFLESNRVALVRSDDDALDVHTAIKHFEEMRIRAPELLLEERRDFIPLYTKTRLGKGQRKKNKGQRWT